MGRIFDCDSFENSGAFESYGGGGRITHAARFALRVVACGHALSLALGRTLVEASHPSPAWAEYLITIRLRVQGLLKVMVVGEGLLRLRASPFGSLPAATLSRWRSIEPWSKLLILPPLGQNI